MQMLNTLVSIKPGESVSQVILMWLKANTTDALAILSYANQNILQTQKNHVMPSLSKEFRQLWNNLPKDSKLLFGDDKYQSHSRHDEKYSRPSKTNQKTLNCFWKHQAAFSGRKTKGGITQRKIRGKAFSKGRYV